MHRFSRRLFISGAAWADNVFKSQEKPSPEKSHEVPQPSPQVQPVTHTKGLPTAEYDIAEETAELQVTNEKQSVETAPRQVPENEPILPREEFLSHEAEIIRTTYKDFDVRSPSTLPANHLLTGHIPKKGLSWRDQVLAVSDFISGHLAHHIMMEEWAQIFDLKTLDIEMKYFIWILHLQMISRRTLTIPIEKWARRREVLQEIQISMKSSWEESCTQILGRPPPQRQKDYLMDMYLVVSLNFEEALSGMSFDEMMNGKISKEKAIVPSDGEKAGNDLALMSFLYRFIPFPRPEDIPMYAYYRLVHYIRFSMALLDRIPDEEILKGNFNFINPMSEVICESYDQVPLADLSDPEKKE